MERINSSLSAWQGNEDLQQRLNQTKQSLLKSPHIAQFLREQDQVTDEMITSGMTKLYEYKKERENCDNCPGLKRCPNLMQGYQPELYVERNHIEISYHACSLKVKEEKQKQEQKLIRSLYIPKDILAASFDQVEADSERMQASKVALQFAMNAKPGEDGMGLYFYGKFGVGKTYLMGAVANELKVRGIETFIIYTPDFFREMRQAIGDGSFQDKLEAVKKAEVLILDDIGAETTSGWTRDDVLGTILQHRMLEKLPTLFTSNYDYDELERHLSYSDKGGTEELKALRIMERIKHQTKSVLIKGENRRGR
ncbi:primosomal protein DnaI [Alkalicoccobacillus porphyridii]|uniref:Primosomal protein DnaI n=1 Tax=Alkalicoccobacillus porphyridii TaxID=2597270 RepID=A0A554A2U9_9BACI|nr:primosomal protein DnaI [Alkalicoccobacillus porphyridii]TSB48020.1 primosomal protein DnaI [Alkalicoccobacillus porphyridii]